MEDIAKRNTTILLVALGVFGAVAAFHQYLAGRDHRAARKAESAACGSEADPADCRARLEANSAACFKLIYVPAKPADDVTAESPAYLDTAAYRACVRSSPEEWDRQHREARKTAR